jgi:rod shape-determining protein MreD
VPAETAPRPIAVFLWSILLLFLQSVVLFGQVPPEYRPNLYLLFAVFLGVRFNSSISLVVPFILGLCHDALTLAPFGLSALGLLVAGYLPHTGRPDVYLEGGLTRWILVIVGTGVTVLLRLLVLLALGRDVSSPWEGLLWQMALHTVLLYPFFAMWEKQLVRRREVA